MEATSIDANDTVESEKTLMEQLQLLGNSAGNYSMIERLGWDEDRYWKIRNRLVESGQLKRGRGRGGSISFGSVPTAPVRAPCGPETVSRPLGLPEDRLYEPVAKVLRGEWATDMGFRDHAVEVTARQGRRDTGGVWTRPDIVVASLRVFPHIPNKYFDLITFEIKPLSNIDVTAVYEALAHRRAATQAYVWLHVPAECMENEETNNLLETVMEEASCHGIGMIVGSDPADYSTWDIRLSAARHDPDPESLNDFIAQQLPIAAKDEMAKWFR